MTDLFNETGHDSIDQRNTEAIRLMEELKDQLEAMAPHERRFVIDMNTKKDENNLRCSGKKLYWLRDLYEKYCI